MGVWASGLYSGDFAMDLRSTFRAVTRLPFDGDKLLQILCDLERAVATNRAHEEHTTFWLVVADQFAKSGISCDSARQKALQIIDTGSDIAMLAKLGMDSAGLRKRQKMLTDLRQFPTAAAGPAKRRSVIKNPQPLLMDVGDLSWNCDQHAATYPNRFLMPSPKVVLISRFEEPAQFVLCRGPEHKIQRELSATVW